MWNSGSEVISRSVRVSSIHYGNPSPAHAYARCVCMTSLDSPGGPRRGDQHGQVVGPDVHRRDRVGRSRSPVAEQRVEGDEHGPASLRPPPAPVAGGRRP